MVHLMGIVSTVGDKETFWISKWNWMPSGERVDALTIESLLGGIHGTHASSGVRSLSNPRHWVVLTLSIEYSIRYSNQALILLLLLSLFLRKLYLWTVSERNHWSHFTLLRIVVSLSFAIWTRVLPSRQKMMFYDKASVRAKINTG